MLVGYDLRPNEGVIVGMLKEKTTYQPSRVEVVLAWAVTALSGVVVAWWVISAWLRGH